MTGDRGARAVQARVWREAAVGIAVPLLAALAFTGCGRKGPPLPPLVKLPVAPGDFVAARRSSSVDIQFVVPAANTDGTRPANLVRVDVYGITTPPEVSDADILRRGTRIGSVAVKAPRDPEETIDPDEPDADLVPPEGPGFDQGAIAALREQLSPGGDSGGARAYVGVGVDRRGRRGPPSRRAAVPLAEPPPAPSAPEVTYDEKGFLISWPTDAAAGEDEGRALVLYDATKGERRLGGGPIQESSFVDTPIEWDTERCYVLRRVQATDGLSIESEASSPTCVTARDTFPPSPPAGLQSVASEGAVSLIWDANSEPDLAGYLVLRAVAPSETPTLITPTPIERPNFRDTLETGARASYVVQAVDKAGNISPSSQARVETAR